MLEENVLIAFGLTLFAGLATGIGSALAFFAKRTNTKKYGRASPAVSLRAMKHVICCMNNKKFNGLKNPSGVMAV